MVLFPCEFTRETGEHMPSTSQIQFLGALSPYWCILGTTCPYRSEDRRWLEPLRAELHWQEGQKNLLNLVLLDLPLRLINVQA